MSLDECLARIDASALRRDFDTLCDCGGRLAGTAGERAAVSFLKQRLDVVPGGTVGSFHTPYAGWQAASATLDLGDGAARAVQPLIGSPPTPENGLLAEIIDLGRGAEADFVAARDRIAGRIVMVRHEYMFDADHVHRIWKYQIAASG